jgi:hypothetical protein
MPRKTASYLNGLRTDLQDVLNDLNLLADDLQASCLDLSDIVPHDVKTDDETVKELFNRVTFFHLELGRKLKAFRSARNKYLEFF